MNFCICLPRFKLFLLNKNLCQFTAASLKVLPQLGQGRWLNIIWLNCQFTNLLQLSLMCLASSLSHLTAHWKRNIKWNRGMIKTVLKGASRTAIQSCQKIYIFKASALWANAFYKSKCPSVCLFVDVYVHVFTFEVPFNGLFSPTSRSRMSNIFRDSESLGKSNGKKWSHIWTFFFEVV